MNDGCESAFIVSYEFTVDGVVSTPAWIDQPDPTLPTLVVYTLDAAFVGYHTVVVRANLNTVPVTSASTSVTFNFLFEVDPCYATVLLPQAVADMAHLIESNHNPTRQSYQ